MFLINKDLYINKMDNGKMVCHMEEGKWFIQMVAIMLAISKMVFLMVKVVLLVLMAGIIKDN